MGKRQVTPLESCTQAMQRSWAWEMQQWPQNWLLSVSSASLRGTGWRIHPSNPAAQFPRCCALTNPTRPGKVMTCIQQENTEYLVFLARQDTWDSFSVNGRANPSSPLCPLCAPKSAHTHIPGLPALLQPFWKGYFAREHVRLHSSRFVLKSSQETENRPQSSKLFLPHIFWPSCGAHRVGCRLDEWLW